MRSFLAFVLALGVATVAQAEYMISVNGVVDPPDSTIVLAPSDTVILDIHGANNGQGPLDLMLLGSDPVSIDASNATIHAGGDLSFVGNLSEDFLINVSDYFGHPYTTGALSTIASGASIQPSLNGLLFDNILFHAEGVGEVVIELRDGITSALYDSQVIHIPEPATLSLLALGTLAMTRRRAKR